MKWLRRYLDEKTPSLMEFAEVVRVLSSGSWTSSLGLRPAGLAARSAMRSVRLCRLLLCVYSVRSPRGAE
jgi:hypothetical protein